MKRWRHVLFAAGLALVLVAGQQLVLLHALGHAADRMANKDSDTPAGCKLHFACSQLASAVAAKPPPALPVAQFAEVAAIWHATTTVPAPTFAFLSRGPPSSFA